MAHPRVVPRIVGTRRTQPPTDPLRYIHSHGVAHQLPAPLRLMPDGEIIKPDWGLPLGTYHITVGCGSSRAVDAAVQHALVDSRANDVTIEDFYLTRGPARLELCEAQGRRIA